MLRKEDRDLAKFNLLGLVSSVGVASDRTSIKVAAFLLANLPFQGSVQTIKFVDELKTEWPEVFITCDSERPGLTFDINLNHLSKESPDYPGYDISIGILLLSLKFTKLRRFSQLGQDLCSYGGFPQLPKLFQ